MGCAAFTIEKDNKESLVVLQEIKSTKLKDINIDELTSNVRKAIAKHHNLSVYEVVLLEERTIPKTSSGKTQRLLCKKLYLNNKLNLIREDNNNMQDNSNQEKGENLLLCKILEQKDANVRQPLIEIYLHNHLASILKVSNVDTDKLLVELGLDSIIVLALIGKIQEEIRVKLEIKDLINFTINTLAADINKKLREKSKM